jgi:hypothetical protein
MVMKETKTFDKEAQKIFVKEVSTIFFFFALLGHIALRLMLILFRLLGSSAETLETSECPQFHGSPLR